MRPSDIFGLMKDTFKAWSEDKASRLGAALAYYTIFAIGPLILVIISIVAIVYGDEAASGQITGAIDDIVGQDGAEFIQTAVKNANQGGAGTLGTIIGAATLLLGAAGLFGQLQDALNTIWGVRPKPGGGIMLMLRERFMTFLMVIGTGLLLLVSLLVNTVLAGLGDLLKDTLPGGVFIWQIVNYGISLGVIILLFATIFKVLPDVKIGWKDVWVGALVSAVLFLIGQIALGFYFGLSNVGSPYGAAGSLVSVLVWIYYSAQILFFGAEFTQIYANKYGSQVEPADSAEFVSVEERARMGMDPKQRQKKRAQRAIGDRRKSPWFA